MTLRLHAINFAMLRPGFHGCAVLGLLDALGGALSFRLLRKGTGKQGLPRVVGLCWQGLDLQHVGHCFACGVPGVGESNLGAASFPAAVFVDVPEPPGAHGAVGLEVGVEPHVLWAGRYREVPVARVCSHGFNRANLLKWRAKDSPAEGFKPPPLSAGATS